MLSLGSLRVCLVRGKSRGGERRGENIFNKICLVQFLRGERREPKSLINSIFASPELGGFGGEGKESKMC
jgi:hypothetical protein